MLGIPNNPPTKVNSIWPPPTTLWLRPALRFIRTPQKNFPDLAVDLHPGCETLPSKDRATRQALAPLRQTAICGATMRRNPRAHILSGLAWLSILASGSARSNGRPSRAGASAQTLQRAQSLYDTGRLSEAEALLRPLSAGDPSNPEVRRADSLLARLLLSQRRYRQALAVASRLAAQPATSAEGHALLARIQFLRNSLSRALREAQTAANLKPSSPTYLRLLGEILLAYGKPKAARAVLQRAGRLSPHNAWILTLQGDTLWQLHAYRKAAAAYRKAATLRDGTIWPLLALDRLGTLLISRHRRDAARRVLQECRRLAPKLGCPFTEGALLPPDPTRPNRPETHVLPPHERRMRKLREQRSQGSPRSLLHIRAPSGRLFAPAANPAWPTRSPWTPVCLRPASAARPALGHESAPPSWSNRPALSLSTTDS